MKTLKKALLIVGGLLALWLVCGIVFVAYSANRNLDPAQYDIDGRISLALKGTEVYAGEQLIGRFNINYTAEAQYPSRLRDAFTTGRRTGLRSYALCYLNIFNGAFVDGTSAEKLAKQLFPEATGTTLVQIAGELENRFQGGTDDLYCNSMAFGEGIYGLEAAARFYFEKTAEALTDDELTLLKNPGDLSGNGNALIDDGGAFMNGLRRQLSQVLTYEQIYSGGYTVAATLDLDVQAALDSTIVNETVPEHFQVGMLLCDYSGNIVGVAGGATPEDGVSPNLLNRTLVPMSVGSSIKPVSVYTWGIENDIITYSDTVPDTPFVGDWPRNYNDVYQDQVTVAAAVRQSKNTVAVRLADTLGADYLYAKLQDAFHFSHLSEFDNSLESVALGYFTGGVTLEELALAYQIFGSGGVYNEAAYFTEVTAADGTVVFRKSGEGTQVVSSQTAGIVNRLLRSNVTLPDGLGTNADMPGVEVIGKTGTVENAHGVVVNTLFAGATPSYVGVVWVGSDDKGMDGWYGTFPEATEVWRRVMEKTPQGKAEFDIDPTLMEAEFCTDTGLLANGCANTEQGWYKPENAPQTCACAQ